MNSVGILVLPFHQKCMLSEECLNYVVSLLLILVSELVLIYDSFTVGIL